MRSDTISFAPGTEGGGAGCSAGLVVAVLNAASACERESPIGRRAMSSPPENVAIIPCPQGGQSLSPRRRARLPALSLPSFARPTICAVWVPHTPLAPRPAQRGEGARANARAGEGRCLKLKALSRLATA